MCQPSKSKASRSLESSTATLGKVSKTPKAVTSPATTARPLLVSMTRDELRGVASAAGVKTGKSKEDTIANLQSAIGQNQVNVKLVATVSVNPEGGTRKSFYIKTLRTYVSGTGRGDEVLLAAPALASK
jgi:hypothetical protein